MRIFGVELSLKNSGFKGGLDEARGKATQFSTDVGKSFSSLRGAFTGISAGIAGIGFGALVTKTLSATGAIQDTADALGVTAEELQGLRAAFSESGTSGESFDKGFAKLVEHIASAKGGNDAALKSFRDLGISLDDLNAKSPADLLKQMADGFRDAKDRGTAFSAVVDLLGKSGRTMASGMAVGADGITELANAADTMSNGVIGALDAIDDAIARSGRSITTNFGKAIIGLEQMWDDFAGSNFMRGIGLGNVPKFDVANKMAASMLAAEAKTASATGTGDEKEHAKEVADLERLRSDIFEQQVANMIAKMGVERQLNELLKERAQLEREAAAAGEDSVEGAKKRLAAEKLVPKIDAARKQVQDGEDKAKALADQHETAKNLKIAEGIEEMKRGMAEKTATIQADIEQAREGKQTALAQAKLQRNQGELDQLVSLEKMTPGQRADLKRQARFNERAEQRAERKFLRTHSVDELQALKDAKNPAKQAEVAFERALKAALGAANLSDVVNAIEKRKGVL